LDNLRHLQHPGDPDVLRQVVEAFLESCPPLLTTLRDTVTQRQSMAAMQVAAHTLKSSCAMVGAVRLAGLCRELEGLAEAAWHAGERIVKEIESAYPVVCEALMEECRKDGFPVADT
jgi:HPt (histidine-containing phosphotransfer) domain-containing protein